MKRLQSQPRPQQAETPPRPQQTANNAQPQKSATGTSTSTAQSSAPKLSDRLTMSEIDAVRKQIEGCWNMPTGMPDTQNLIVEIVVEVNQDGSVRKAEVVDRSRMSSDSFYRRAAESAQRAILRCNPLPLPQGKYEEWKKITFSFTPQGML
jgi:hypothetical protein